MSIIRQKTHSQNFVILCKSVLFDPKLSLKAKGLWAYLMSLPDDWHINCREVSKHMTDGRDSVLSTLRELAKYGYAKKVQPKKTDGQFGHGGWIVFESKQPVCEEKPPCPENPYAVDSPILSTKELRKERKENKQKKDGAAPLVANAPSLSFSQDIKDLAKDFIDSMQEIKADYVLKGPSYSAFLTQIDCMVRIDKRDPKKIIALVRWILSESFWNPKLFKKNPAKYLRANYDSLEQEMKMKPKGKQSQSDYVTGIPFDSSIAQLRKNQSEAAYISYLRKLSDKKHYNEYLKSKERE